MSEESVYLPDGILFSFWEDRTLYSRTYHVAQQHPHASDSNPGSEDAPFLTINRAAEILLPGEEVLIHSGIYRECVRPARGGTAPDAMICYRAADGEAVSIRGSESFHDGFTPSTGWGTRQAVDRNASIWRREFPAEWFMGYNPLLANNMTNEYTTFNSDWTAEEILVQQQRRVLVFADGKALKQVNFYYQLAQEAGTFWVEDPGLAIHMRLWTDEDPNGLPFEVTNREQVFAPQALGLGYIRVSDFTLEYAADSVPVPQRALLSAHRGHHWIIENNHIRYANSTGIDVGNESWHAARDENAPRGGHIIRNNHISDCGFCGIAGVGCVDGTLVEHNLIENIGRPHIERVWESAGLKMHTTVDLLIRRNVFRHISESCGIWLDYLNRNSRITENVFYDFNTLHPVIYIEVSHDWNMVDHNVVWDARKPRLDDCFRYGYGTGIGADTGEKCIIANNVVGEVGNAYGISCDLVQAARVVEGRVGLCKDHQVLNNLLYHCAKRVMLSRAPGNACDGNLYEADSSRSDWLSFCVQYPAPEALLNFEAWQEHYGFDAHGAQLPLTVAFDAGQMQLTVMLAEDVTAGFSSTDLHPALGVFPGLGELKKGENIFCLNAGPR